MRFPASCHQSAAVTAAAVTAAGSKATRADVKATRRAARAPTLYPPRVTEFEVFKRNRSPAIKAPAVTLMQRGQLSLNEAAFTALGAPKAVELMYSRADRLIGIRAVDPAEPHAYIPRTASKNKGRGPYIISGAAFFSHYGIDLPQTTRHVVTMQDDILIIDLKQAGIPVVTGQNSLADRGSGRGS